MFRAAYRSSSGLQTVFIASGLYIRVVIGRCPGWTTAGHTRVYKSEAENTFWSL
jgi:hypothetical protein